MARTAAVALESLAWPLHDLGVALQELGLAARLIAHAAEAPRPPDGIWKAPLEAMDQWIDRAAAGMGLEAEPVECSYAQVEEFIRRCGPALLRVQGARTPYFLALLPSRGITVRVLGPDLKVHRVPVESVRQALCRLLEAGVEAENRRMLEAAGVSGDRLSRALALLLRERMGAEVVGNAWILRLHPGSDFARQVWLARIPRRLVELGLVHAIETGLFIVSWWIIGRAALQGHVDSGWLVAWALLLPTMVPFRWLGTWLQGQISIQFGGLLKQRLLAGALRLEPDEVLSVGSGQFLGRVIESDAVESLALSGGFQSLMAVVELLLAAAVLTQGAGGRWQSGLIVAWVILTAALAWRYYRRRREWTHSRLDLTDALVERMVGQSTRLVQEARDRWHRGEDDTLERYLRDSAGMDRTLARLFALVPRGALTLGVVGLAPEFIAGTASRAALAIGLGGLLLAFRALQRLVLGLSNLVDAVVAWEQVDLLFAAASRPQEIGAPEFAISRDLESLQPEAGELSLLLEMAMAPEQRAPALVEANDLSYRYPSRPEPVIRGLSLQVQRGDRILLGGRSGGGKSSLASLLAGIRHPEAGLLMLDGLDRQTLGHEGWRKSVVLVPQFHENHVIGATMSFNLLMGRRWPPTYQDLQDAEAVCEELGLGPLLQRMPGGMVQMVGESGWQLSHGERSRLFIARSLLQNADLIIMDESFGALDPENLTRAMECVRRRASTLIVIAHP